MGLDVDDPPDLRCLSAKSEDMSINFARARPALQRRSGSAYLTGLLHTATSSGVKLFSSVSPERIS